MKGAMLLTPLSEPTRRRLLAGALALAVNSSFIALILFTPRELPIELEASPVELVFVTIPAPEPEPEPVVEPEPDTEPIESIPVEQDAEVLVEAVPETEPVDPPINDRPDLVDESEPERLSATDDPGREHDAYTGDALAYPAGPGSTAFVLRETFCLSSSDANQEAGNCPDATNADGLGLLQYAGSHDLSELRERFGLDLTPDEIRILHGVAPHELAGQPTVDTARRSTSSSDEMRETLPTLRPDPAFGD
jgi:protein TonB